MDSSSYPEAPRDIGRVVAGRYRLIRRLGIGSFKAAWRNGAAHADMSADKFLARLCALVPPPGFT